MEQFAPMKFEHAELEDIDRFVKDDAWVMEQKLDGTRALVRINEFGICFITHGGKLLTHSAAAQHFMKIEHDLFYVWQHCRENRVTWYLDGEIMIEDGRLWLFDAPRVDFGYESGVRPASPLYARRQTLEWLFNLQPNFLTDKPYIRLAPQQKTMEEKARFVSDVIDYGAEGIMVKHLTSPYRPGARVTDSLKIKFVKTADVVVLERDTGGGKNALLGVWRELEGPIRELVRVGACSMIGKPDAQPGQVIEVKYLYKAEGGHLYQPRMMKIREDKDARDCTMDQFQSYSKEVLS